MKKTLLLLVMISVITGAFAQKRKKTEQPLTGYAITAVEKGGRSWKEVRLINITTGEEIRCPRKKYNFAIQQRALP